MGRPIVVMGTSGSGKTTVGVALAERLHSAFVDGDDLHPPENVAKMTAGAPLTDADREPWLSHVGKTLAKAEPQDAPDLVIACSALKRAYRVELLYHAPSTLFVHLNAELEVLLERMRGRSDHFMPASLLDSQLTNLEPLSSDEAGVVIDASAPTNAVVDAIVQWLG